MASCSINGSESGSGAVVMSLSRKTRGLLFSSPERQLIVVPYDDIIAR